MDGQNKTNKEERVTMAKELKYVKESDTVGGRK
jgi:hypothetical protein